MLNRVRGYVLTLVFLLLLAPPSAYAERTQTVTVNPLAMLAGELNFAAEKRLSESMSYWSKAMWAQLYMGSSAFSAGGGSLGLNYYPEQTALTGFHVGPSLTVLYLSASGYDSYGYYYVEGGPAVGVGADAGYQWILDGGLVLDFGVSVTVVSAFLRDGSYSYTATAVTPGVSIGIGYGW